LFSKMKSVFLLAILAAQALACPSAYCVRVDFVSESL